MKNKELYNLLVEHARLAGYAMGCLEGVRHHNLPEDVRESLKESIEEIDKMHEDVMDKYWGNE